MKIPKKSGCVENKNRPPTLLFCIKLSFSLISEVFCFANRPEEKQLFQFCLGLQWLLWVAANSHPSMVRENRTVWSCRCPLRFSAPASPALWTVFCSQSWRCISIYICAERTWIQSLRVRLLSGCAPAFRTKWFNTTLADMASLSR